MANGMMDCIEREGAKNMAFLCVTIPQSLGRGDDVFWHS